METIQSGLGYFKNMQSSDGKWLDFSLPYFGTSDAWVTAYIGYSLSHLAKLMSDKEFDEWLLRATNWLMHHLYYDYGWGYNSEYFSDADSTAFGILFLSSIGKPVHRKTYERLLEFQKEDGGFCTYLYDGKSSDHHQKKRFSSFLLGNSWEKSHQEITPVALNALLTKYDYTNDNIQKGIRYVLDNRAKDGTWQSFWWDTNLYSTYVNLRFMNCVREGLDSDILFQTLRINKPKNCFELALLGECLLLIENVPRDLLDKIVFKLASLQNQDGSWNTDKILRGTNPLSLKPWNDNFKFNFFPDQNRLFTSATVLRLLAEYKTHSEMKG